MKLLNITRLLKYLNEGIDIHGLQRRFRENPTLDHEVLDNAVNDYRSTLQGRKKELLKPFGLDDLDKFKDNPDAFVKMVDYAVDSFKEKKEQEALYKKVYEDDRCLITMPKGPEGAAAAGSFCKNGDDIVCPWCVCIKYPENEKWWEAYDTAALAFVYAKENRVVSDACCILLTARNAVSVIKGNLAYSQLEGIENKGLNDKPEEQRKVLERLYGKTGLTDKRLAEILAPVLKPMERELNAVVAEQDIITAVQQGDTKRVRECLDAGANVDTRNEGGWTPLLQASKQGYLEICKLLVGAGADVKAQNRHGWTPLLQASKCGHLQVCKLLIDAGADVQARSGVKDGLTPLYQASGWGHLEVCKLLIDAGAEVNTKDREGCSPLFYAVSNAHSEVCKLLIDAGAEVDIKDEDGCSLLFKAAGDGYTEICKHLIAAGADVEAKNDYNFSPLGNAARNGHAEICKLLIDAGADVNAEADNGQTALTLAATPEIKKLLRQHGAE